MGEGATASSSFWVMRPILHGIRKDANGYGAGMARVLRGLNLTIRQGETLVVMGESGSGKRRSAAYWRAIWLLRVVCVWQATALHM